MNNIKKSLTQVNMRQEIDRWFNKNLSRHAENPARRWLKLSGKMTPGKGLVLAGPYVATRPSSGDFLLTVP